MSVTLTNKTPFALEVDTVRMDEHFIGESDSRVVAPGETVEFAIDGTHGLTVHQQKPGAA